MGKLGVENGRRIYYEHHAGRARPVVCVHGWGLSGRCWDVTVANLIAAGHEVLTFDQRCCGRSDKDFGSVSLPASAGDIVTLLEETGVEDPVLVGWSFGAVIATMAAAQLGERLSGLCLICPATPRFANAKDFPHGAHPQEIVDTVNGLREDRPDFLHAVAERIGRLGPNTVEWLWQQFMEASPRADGCLAELGEVDQRHLLPGLGMPTLVISGSADRVVDPDIHRFCADLIPNSLLHEFGSAGHAPFLEERVRFNEALLAFLAAPAATVRDERDPADPITFFA